MEKEQTGLVFIVYVKHTQYKSPNINTHPHTHMHAFMHTHTRMYLEYNHPPTSCTHTTHIPHRHKHAHTHNPHAAPLHNYSIPLESKYPAPLHPH